MLRLAGFSAGRSVCARGGWSAGRASLLRRLAFDRACCLTHSAKQDGLRYVAFLFRRGSGSPVARSRIAGAVIRLGWFTLGLRVFCGDPDGSTRGRGGRRRRGVGALLRSITPAFVVLSRCFAFDHACCLPQSAKQDGLRYVAFLFRRGSGSPVARSRIAGAVIRLGWFISGLRVFWRRSRRSTRERGGRGTESAARQSAFLRDCIGFVMFSAGSPLGAARPQTCAKEPLALWTLFI